VTGAFFIVYRRGDRAFPHETEALTSPGLAPVKPRILAEWVQQEPCGPDVAPPVAKRPVPCRCLRGRRMSMGTAGWNGGEEALRSAVGNDVAPDTPTG
jgi:hypothetical protein